MFLQYEVCDAATNKASSEPATGATERPEPKGSVRVLTSIEFLQREIKVYETKPIEAHVVTAAERKAVIFQMEIPLQSLKPGFYTCQINVIDDVGGSFAFLRWPILIKATVNSTGPATPGVQ
jgi:hypothetical protein